MPTKLSRPPIRRLAPRLVSGPLVAAVCLLAGCSDHPSIPLDPPKPAAGSFSVSPAAFGTAAGGPGGLCTGLGGDLSACTPRPRPKFDIGNLGAKPIVDLDVLPAAERPEWVLCRLDYREKPPLWTCAEVYTSLPR
jgi:hypothetical protein